MNLPSPAHPTYPLSSPVLASFSLTPEFDYQDSYQARKLNAWLQPSQTPFTAAELGAAGLQGRILLHVFTYYLRSDPDLLLDLDSYLLNTPGEGTANQALRSILASFPTARSFSFPSSIPEYLVGSAGAATYRHALYCSLALRLAAEENRVFTSRDGVFSDRELRESEEYQKLSLALLSFFRKHPPLKDSGKSLLDFLLEPIRRYPGSLFDQLLFMRNHWGDLIPPGLMDELLLSLDRFREEFISAGGFHGAPQDPLGYLAASYQEESDLVRFSADSDWMPRLILLAKNIYVWLDQLSRRYQRSINRLDLIPPEEFERLASWGITGLWLIGIWERSSASGQIKRLCGNPDAVPSAYSLYDYSVAESLGGEQAYQALTGLAAQYGIRLAADMVPNHMGIDSKWVQEHPDWFLSLDQAPYPNYSFNGPNLSPDPNLGIFLEDHYYDKSDAAVVFKRVDFSNHDTRYIYHGNDGTSMPWNDTAQLNFLKPDVREAVIRTILQVAKKFPVIRFDAAMTLARKHYQRLWFPAPGTGGAIPTRSDHALSAHEFKQLMPAEFWREVVDRVAAEAPDTLLLAEAFWMMEGYFVRSLGMHRVYNSAFMHMLRDEDNAKYRDLILKTLSYDPQILKRYVNFMNNPDEETAIAQFGADGKYFGTCLLMVTLPGLPMFGHGQIEGYTEKYGMEYHRAYYDEAPNQTLVDRHQQLIFPLLRRRYLFAEVDNFVLYDLVQSDGSVNQDVYAFSNHYGDERALVLYHNKWGDTSGRIFSSPAVNGRTTSLLAGLGLTPRPDGYLLFRDHVSGLEYIRSLSALQSQGLGIALGAYQFQVLLDFKVVQDRDGSYQLLTEHLAGRGAVSLEGERISLILGPLLDTWVPLNEHLIKLAFDRASDANPQQISSFLDQFLEALLMTYPGSLSEPADSAGQLSDFLAHLLELQGPFSKLYPRFNLVGVFWSLLLADPLRRMPKDHLRVLADWLPHPPDTPSPYRPSIGSGVFLATADLLLELNAPRDQTVDWVQDWFRSPRWRSFLMVHEYGGAEWFNQESFESLLDVAFSIQIAMHLSVQPFQEKAVLGFAEKLSDTYRYIRSILPQSEFQVSKLENLLANKP